MNPQLISRIERSTWVLGVVATAVSGIVWQVPGMIAAGTGAVLGALNFWALHRLGAAVIRRALSGEGAGKAAGLVALLMAKMGLLFVCVWLAIFKFGLLVVPFTIGITAFVAAIFAASFFGVGLLSADSPTAEEAKSHG